MRSDDKLTENEVNADELRKAVEEAIRRHGGGRKAWHQAVSKRVQDFRAWRTLYDYTQRNARRDRRVYKALMTGLSLSAEELNLQVPVDPPRRSVLEENELYLTINAIIDRIDVVGSQKEIRLCAMHGTDQSRRDREPNPPIGWAEFVKRMTRCIGAPDWRVEILYNVPSKGRLDQIQDRLKQAEDAENHEVRAYGIEGSLQVLCPMIIGDRDAFLGISHPRYYRTGLALYVQGAESIRFIERYWSTLWSRARIIRSEAGEITSEIDRLEQELNLRGKNRNDWLMGDLAQAIDAVKRIGGQDLLGSIAAPKFTP